MALTIGTDFTFSAGGSEDQIYGFSYSTMKPKATETPNTDAFLISSIVQGSLFYNAGSLASPHYFKVSAFSAVGTGIEPVGALELRITGVFINGFKVSGSDGNLWWAPDNGSAADPNGGSTISFTGTLWGPDTPAVTVQAVDNVDGIFGNSNDIVSTDNTGTATPNGATASVNLAQHINVAPTLTGGFGAMSFAEDQLASTVVTTVTATDPDPGAVITYSLTGADMALFSINASTGVVTFNPSPNFEIPTDTVGPDNVYDLVVNASDGIAANVTQALTITVTDVNDPPINTNPAGVTTDGAGLYTFGGNISVADEDSGGNPNENVTLTVAQGTLTVTALSGAATITAGADGTNTVTISGSVTDVNATLVNGLAYAGNVTFQTGATPDTLTISTNDGQGALNSVTTTTTNIIMSDNVAPTPVFQSVVYDATTHDVTITGNAIDTLVQIGGTMGDAAHGGTNVLAQLTLANLIWNDGNGGTGDFTSGVTSAYVLDAHTLILHTNGSVGFEPTSHLDGGTFGNGVMDTLTVVNGFSHDPGGNAAVDGTGALNLLGNINAAEMPHSYSMDMTAGYGTLAVDDTLGASVSNPWFTIDATAGDVMHISGLSAAQVDVYGNNDYSGGSTNYLGLIESSHFDGHSIGTGTWVEIDNHDAVNNGTPAFGGVGAFLQFDDGSMLLTNVTGSIATLSGGAHDDQLIAGWNTNDRLAGGAGNDLLIGGQGDNQIYGGTGNDVIFGWGGNDYLSGGSGQNTFVEYTGTFWGNSNGRDTIADFKAGAGGDIIDFANAAVSSLVSFDGNGHAIAGASIVQSGNDTLIILGTNDSIRLVGVSDLTTLTTANFESVHFNLDNGSTI
jgi:Ca2+-binding RTX toxin-like protein